MKTRRNFSFLHFHSNYSVFLKCCITIKTSKCCFCIVLNNYQLCKEYLSISDLALVVILNNVFTNRSPLSLSSQAKSNDFFQQFSLWNEAVRKTLLTRMGAGWEGVYVWASYSSYIHNHTLIP
jgi:hypothetical protein